MERLGSVKRSQMNAIIMDYLVAEGFKEAAEKFKVESGVEVARICKPAGEVSMEQMDYRIEVRRFIEEGDILQAINCINNYCPELLDDNKDLYFKLQQQHLIELIRKQDLEGALSFAQEQLSVEEEFLQLKELERTLALLAFDRPETSPYSDLLDISHRQQLASEINGFMLKEECGSFEVPKPQLVSLVKLLHWTQNELDKKKVKYPKMTDLENSTLENSDD